MSEKTLKSLVESGFYDEFASPHVKDRKSFGAAVLNELRNAKVNVDGPPSGIGSLVQSLFMIGLMPSKHAGLVWVVPYGGKPTVAVGYKGFLELGWRSGYLARVTPQVVLAGEECEWTDTEAGPVIRHKISSKRPDITPEVIDFAYCSWTATNGTTNAVRSEGWFIRQLHAKADSRSPWKSGASSMLGMILKTPVRVAAKFWNTSGSTELAAALAAEDESDEAERGALEPHPGNGDAARRAIEAAGIQREPTNGEA